MIIQSLPFHQKRPILFKWYLFTCTWTNKEKLRAVATDGHRLAQAEISLPEGAKDMSGIILPEKLLEKLES